MKVISFSLICEKLLQTICLFGILISFSCKYKTICSIPIRIDKESKHILLPVTFNGQVNDFVFDTGSSITSVSEDNHTNTDGKKDFDLLTFNSDTIVSWYPKGQFNIGPFEVTVPFVVKESDNVLGMDIISQYCWYFDLEKMIVQVSNSPIDRLGKEAFSLDFSCHNDNGVSVELCTKPTNKFTMLFDTGYGKTNGLWLFRNGDSIPYEKWKINESDLFFQPKSKNWIWMSDSLQVGDYTLDYLLFIFDSDRQRIKRFNEIGYDGLIPVDFVYRYKRFYIDPKAQKIFFYKENPEKRKERKRFFDHVRELFKHLKPIE